MKYFLIFIFIFAIDAVGAKKNLEQEKQRIKEEFERYQTEEKENKEINLFRQRLFHEKSRHHIGLDWFQGDLDDFKYFTSASGEVDLKTRGIGISYSHFFLQRYFLGRFGLGFYSSLIGADVPQEDDEEKFKILFITLSPRFTYEAQYWIGQLLVPFFTIGQDRVFNKAKSNDPKLEGDFTNLVWSAGILINLNRLDSGTATESFITTGIKKCNLTLAFQSRPNDTASLSSNIATIGFRIEY